MHRIVSLWVFSILLLACTRSIASLLFPGTAGACPNLPMEFQPIDYRVASQAQRELVEKFHFTPKVATLQSGESGELGADISYTLRAFPNHPRALYAIAELGRRQKKATPTRSYLSVECWFERAVRFRPDDAQVKVIYGLELLKDGNRAAAVDQLEKGVALAPDDGNAHYNVGLAYFQLGDYQSALDHAKKAESLGFPLQGLKQKLEKAGKWQ